jgi:hypothetical protein
MNLLFHRLNARQKEILKSKDLPTNWLKLSYSQKKAIVAIGEMLEYVEKKYNKKFCYNGYTASMPLFGDEEALFVYAEGDDPATSTFSVERAEHGFKDGYAWVTQQPVVQAEMEERLGKIFEGESYKLFVILTGVADDGHVKAAHIYIYIEEVTEEKLEEYLDLVAAELKKDQEREINLGLYLYKKGIIQDMNLKNHKKICSDYDPLQTYSSYEVDRREKGCGWEKDD